MALDATVGGANSNSYVTVEEADAYFEDRLHVAKWSALEPAGKASALITSTRLLDWYVTFKGVRSTAVQALQWPRTEVIRRDGTEIAVDLIPYDLKQATFELALASIDADRVADSDLAGLNQAKVGPLMIKMEETGPYSTKKEAIPEYIWRILSDLSTRSSIGVVRLMRA